MKMSAQNLVFVIGLGYLASAQFSPAAVVPLSSAADAFINSNFPDNNAGAQGSNVPPSVSITSPTNGASFPAATVTIDAMAVDSDGSMTNVEFFDGGTSLGSDAVFPFGITVDLPAGSHTLSAVARDNQGAVGTSSNVFITVASVVITLFAEVTSEYSSRNGKYHYLGIVLNGRLISAPKINSAITGGSAVIDGDYTIEEAFELAAALEKPLDVPLRIVDETSF